MPPPPLLSPVGGRPFVTVKREMVTSDAKFSNTRKRRFLRADWSRTRREISITGSTLVGGANDLGAVYQLTPHQPPKEELGQRLSYSRSADPTEPCPLADCNLMKLAPFTEQQLAEALGRRGPLARLLAVSHAGVPSTDIKLTPQSQPGVSLPNELRRLRSGGASCYQRPLQLLRRQGWGSAVFRGQSCIDNRGTFVVRRLQPAAPAILCPEGCIFPRAHSARRISLPVQTALCRSRLEGSPGQAKAFNGQRPSSMRLVGPTVFARYHGWFGEAVASTELPPRVALNGTGTVFGPHAVARIATDTKG